MDPRDLTHELRWFIDGGAPQPVTDAVEMLPLERRSDRYLPLHDIRVGLKLRADRLLEVKQQGGSNIAWAWKGASGWIQTWTCWTFDFDTTRTDWSSLDTWQILRKERRRRVYELAGDDLRPAAEGEALPPAAAAFEVTTIDGDRAAWTVALECWGIDDALVAHVLTEVARREVDQAPWDELRAERSRSYPAWLVALR